MWFHIRLLENCNLHCSHCYASANDRSEIMDFSLFQAVSHKAKSLQKYRPQRMVAYLSGGEPLLHPDFERILAVACECFDQVNILTNGTLERDWEATLAAYKQKVCVQVSIDGNRETHDFIRGKGVYDRALKTLYALKKHGIKHWMSYSVSQLNRHCYQDFIALALKTDCIHNNVTPYTGKREWMLDYLTWKEFKYLYQKSARIQGLPLAAGENCCGFRYRCGAYFIGPTIHPDGNVSGCARHDHHAGGFEQMERYLIQKPLFMWQTCMQNAWGDIPNLEFLSRLES